MLFSELHFFHVLIVRNFLLGIFFFVREIGCFSVSTAIEQKILFLVCSVQYPI